MSSYGEPSPMPPPPKEELIQPKKLYCRTCNVFSEPDYRLTCGECGDELETCWWALLNRKNAKQFCSDCRNRFWCWTNSLNGRIPRYRKDAIATEVAYRDYINRNKEGA